MFEAGVLLILLKMALMRSTVSYSKLKYSRSVACESYMFRYIDLHEYDGAIATRNKL